MITLWAFLVIPLVLLVGEAVEELHFRYLQRKHGCAAPRYVRSFPFGLRATWQFYSNYKNNIMNEYVCSEFLQNDTRTARCQTLSRTIFMTADSENIKAILATQFNDFSLGERLDNFKKLLGVGVFTASGHAWQTARALLRPQFTNEQVSRLSSLELSVQDLMQNIREKSTSGVFDIQELFFMLTLDTATEFLFGESTDSLSGGKRLTSERAKAAAQFQYSFNKAQQYLLVRQILQKFYFLHGGKEFNESCRNCHEFVEYYVDRALNDDHKEEQGKFVFLHELSKQTRDPEFMRDQALNIALAGRDTTAGTLSFAMALLVRHKHVWEKLRSVVLEEFGTGTENINFQTLKRCEYLKWVINEVLRLYPIVPINFRQATKDTTLPSGGGANDDQPIFVPKGTMVFYSVYSMHHDPKVWGDDCELFKPERWGDIKGSQVSWKYLPFNGGPRICLGQQFALTEIAYTLVRLLQTFEDVQTTPEALVSPIQQESTLTVAVKDGVHVQFTETK